MTPPLSVTCPGMKPTLCDRYCGTGQVTDLFDATPHRCEPCGGTGHQEARSRREMDTRLAVLGAALHHYARRGSDGRVARNALYRQEAP